jgi:hypothetical protein
MNALEILYENKIQHSIFLERKIKIIDKYTILVGAKLSGKTYLIYDYIQSNKDKEYLYIDLNNLKDLEFHSNKLQKFIYEKNIKILVIENYDYSFLLPKVSSIILSCSYYKHIDNFSFLKVMPLDFEEYLSFDNKHQNAINSFNSFLRYGNIAEIINYNELHKVHRNYEIIKLSYTNETINKIYELLIKNSAQAKSTFLLYTLLKRQIKISKDFFYKTIKIFENNYSIIYCSKYDSPKAVKKIYCYNHSFVDNVTYSKNFSYQFSNMIFLELYTKYEDIFYSDDIDFYIFSNQSIILSIPFYNNIILSKITSKILKSIQNLNCNNITIVTISHKDSIFLDNIPCEILPFYEWAIVL